MIKHHVTGETSFVARLTARAEQEEVDMEQLEEFELLEQYADDNASFLSNISTVNKVVKQNMDSARSHKMPPITNIIKPPSTLQSPPEAMPVPPTAASVPPTATPVPPPGTVCDHDLSSEEDENDDTSVSSDYDDDEIACQKKHQQISEKSANDDLDVTLVDGEEMGETTNLASAQMAPPSKPIQRKVAQMDPSRQSLLASVQQFSDSEAELNNRSQSDSEETVSETVPGNNHHGRTKSQLEIDNQGIPGQFMANKSSQSPLDVIQTQTKLCSQGDFETQFADSEDFAQELDFGDDMEAWDDSRCETPIANQGMKAEEKGDMNHVIRKSILNREPGSGDASLEKSTPPTSQLVSKLFPKLRQEKSKLKPVPEPQQQQQQMAAAAVMQEQVDGVQSKLLRDKLAQLEHEIERFRTENTNLSKLRKEREHGIAQLHKEMAEFDKQKNDELKRLQEFKNEETKKLKREKKQFETYQQQIRSMPNKKEREEIDALKTQLTELQEEMKRKESRWTSSMSRLREKCETLTAENTELKDEIKLLEKQRLQTWQKRETAPKLKEELSRPPPVQKSVLPPMKSPKPETQPAYGPRDSALGLSTNLDLDESDLRVSDEPLPTKSTSSASPQQPEMVFTPTPYTATRAPLSPMSELSLPQEMMKKPLTRKKATPASLISTIDKGNEQYEEVSHTDGKVEKLYSNGAREILFTNGTRKQVSANGESIIVSFFNGDMKQILPDQRVVYFYSDAQTTHTTYPDGLEIIQFSNQQMEKHYPDGTKEITFPDQTIKYLFPNGIEESIYPDGTVIRIEKNGEKTVEFPNGQREVHTQHYKRREYPDGTVKTVYPDGKQETRYSSGRVRVKDNDGNIIVDKRL